MSKTFNQVKLNVNFTAISPSSNMSNIESDDNISETFAKIHHWYVKTNGFQASSSPLVSTSNDGIVTTLPSTTGGFLKNTGTAGGAWTTLGDSDIPNTIVRKTGNNTLSGLFGPTSNNGANLGSNSYRFQNIYGTHLFGTDFNGFTIGKSVPSDAVFTDTVPYISSITGPNTGNGISNISFNDDGAVDIQKATFLTEHPSITKQTDTTSTDPPAHGGTFTVVDDVKRDTNGHVTKINTKTVTLPTLPTASTSTAGIVKLSSSTSSTSTSLAATPSAVKSAYDLANNFITGYANNHLITIASKTPQLIWRDTENAFMGTFRFNFVTNNANVTINDVGVVFYKSTVTLSDETSTQSLPCELLKTDTSVTGVSVSTSSQTNKTFYAITAKFTEGVVSIYIRPWADYTFNGNSYTTYGDINRLDLNNSANAIAGTYNSSDKERYNPADIDATTSKPAKYITTGNLDTYVGYQPIVNSSTADNYQLGSFNFNETPSFLYGKNTTYIIAQGDSNGQIKVTPSSGSAYNVSVKGLGSAAYTTSTAYATASHTHDTLVSKTLTAETIDSTAGNFFFKGNNLLGNVNDWVGMQGDAGNDKFQLIVNGNNFLIRQNDTGGTNSTNWTNWVGNMRPDNVTGSNGITVETVTTMIGSGDDSFIYDSGVNVKHSNSVTAVTTAGMLKVKYDAQGHITGSSSITKSDITALGISASNHTHSNYLGAATTSSSYYGMANPDGTTTDWIRTTEQGIIPYESGSLGSGHQSLGTATWYFKNSYIDNMTSGYITLAGELPQLKFQQKTSGSEYNNANSGIKCYPGNTNGMNMLIQSGGNIIIGSGEFPTSFYNATKFTAESYTDGGEQTYIGSDNNVYVITGGNTITDRNVFVFGTNFNLPISGKVGFRYGTYDSITTHSLTSAATTTARTWTLPNATGTIALTSDIPTVSVSRNLTSGTKVGTITINGTATDLYCQTNTDTKVTDTVGTANTYYPAGLTATSTTTGTQVFDTSLKFIGTTGSTSAVGKAQLVLGNATASGTANNKQGSIVVYGSTAYAHTIQGAPTAARTLTLPDASGTIALTGHTHSYIPLSGSNAITGNLCPSTSNTRNLGSSSLLWDEVYANFVNTNGICQSSGSAGGSITSYSSIIPNSNSYNLGSTSKKWGTIYVDNISDATTGATHAVDQLVSTTGHSGMMGPLIPKLNSDANCTLGSSSYNWYSVYASNIFLNGYKVISVAGTDALSGNIKFSVKQKGIWGMDKNGNSYPYAYDNGSNLWIGSSATKATHHVGSTYISSGWGGSAGNESIFISVPKSNNTDGTNYKVWHAGNSKKSFTCSSANNYTITVQKCYCILDNFVIINITLTTTIALAAGTTYTVATIPSTYSADSVFMGSGSYQVGGSLPVAITTWVTGTSIKFGTATANSSTSTKTIRISLMYSLS